MNTKAFSLVEVIVSLVIVMTIGAVSWTAVNVLSPTSQATRVRIKAEHLITLTQEELHQYAQTQSNFDNIGPGWPAPNCILDQPDNACGFLVTSSQFPEFTGRTLTYIASDSTPQLKKFDIHVTWQDLGNPQQVQALDSVVLLARPPDPLPGNIVGLVTDNTTQALLTGATIVATNVNNPNIDTAYSQNVVSVSSTGQSENYTFVQPGTGFFVLGAGTWSLTASLAGYNTWGPETVVVGSSQQVDEPISMVPLLTDATISGNWVDASGNPLTMSNSSSTVQLNENGSSSPSNVTPQSISGGGGFLFNVTFTDPNQRCFTLYTLLAYKSNLAGPFNCNGYPYESDGWSSAQANYNESALNCGETWGGDATSDSSGVYPICVTPGHNFSQNVTLAQVPQATVTVQVIDQNGNPILGGTDPLTISVLWHDGTPYGSTPFSTNSYPSTEPPGYYQVKVPAEQELFPAGDYVQVYAQATVPLLSCCNQTGTSTVTSPTVLVVGSLLTNSDLPVTVTIPSTTTTPLQCGNATGQIIDAKAQASLSGANVSLANLSQITTAGDYTFQCSQTPPFSLPAGPSSITVTDNGYYPYNAPGFSYYNITWTPDIIANQLAPPFPTIGLWPMGVGTVTGTVTQQGTGAAIGNVLVVLNLGTGPCPVNTVGTGNPAPCEAISNPDGTFEFDNVPETWPPPVLAGNLQYNQAVLMHYFTVADSNLYEAYNGSGFTVVANATTTQNIQLQPKAAL